MKIKRKKSTLSDEKQEQIREIIKEYAEKGVLLRRSELAKIVSETYGYNYSTIYYGISV